MEASPFQVNPKVDGHIHVARLMRDHCTTPLLTSKAKCTETVDSSNCGASMVEEARETVMRFAWYVERAKVKEEKEDLGRLRAALPRTGV